jgi:fermentation-respiration switch protein FrsA (DUF1100 family)
MNEQKVQCRKVSFRSEGERVVGNLFLPSEKPPIGLVVAVGPLTSVKEQAAGAYARAMAERGYASLAFDYRFFGESGGEPRQFESPQENIKDIRNAATAMLSDARFKDLPLFGFGVCFGAGPMVCAVAEDPRFRAFAGVAGVYTDSTGTKKMMGEQYESELQRARAAEKAWNETGIAETIPAVAPDAGDVAMPLREAYEFYGTMRGAAANYTNGFAVQSRAYTLPFDAMAVAEKLTVPVAIVHSERALVPAWAHEFYEKVTAQKQELWLESEGQIDFYDDPRLIKAASDMVANWFQEQVPA